MGKRMTARLQKYRAPRTKATHVALLDNWNTLNASLMKLKEDEVAQLLTYEQENNNRITFTLRLHARLSKLRRERERRMLARSAGKNAVLMEGEE